MPDDHSFLPKHGYYKNLKVYRVAEALYDLTYLFCERYLPSHGDRTKDQMVQAARSGKQNIAEGNQDGTTSSEVEIRLTGIAHGSIEELKGDYEDFLRTRSLPIWDMQHPRFEQLREWTRSKDFFRDYIKKAEKMNSEEMANLCLTLCHQAIYLLQRLIKAQETRFVTEGGIKERMYAARTGYREEEKKELEALREENKRLKELLKKHGIEF